MNQYYPTLFSPIRIGSLMAKNRIISGPNNPANLPLNGFFSDENIAIFEAKARGGAGIVFFGESYVHTKTGIAHNRTPALDDPEILSCLSKFTDAIHRHGALAGIEISHPGRRANRNYYGGTIWGPSDGIGIDENHIVKEMPVELIHELIEAYGNAAEIAMLGGMDIVMVHMGHGWLVHQFMSPLTNHRTDEYGGSLENRFRFALEVIDNIQKKCGRNFPIALRISATEIAPGGLSVEDMQQFVRLVDGKVALIDVSEGTFHIPSTARNNNPSMFVPHGVNVHFATDIKSVLHETAVSAMGGIGQPEQMEEIISTGQADMVTLVRAIIADPDLPRKARDGNASDITPCQRCLACLSGDFVPYVKYATHTAKCSVNPSYGHELEVFTPPAVESHKRVVIVGGGPAGMEAALVAARRGHKVILCEKNAALGGTIRYAEHISFKEDLDRFMRVMIARVEREKNITVLLNQTVTAEFAEELHPDVLVAAIGAEPVILPIAGIDKPHVVVAVGMHEKEHEKPIGKRVVIIGGGLVGCEEALELLRRGHEVTIVEMREEIAINADYLHRQALLYELERYGEQLHILTGTICREILDDAVRVTDAEEKDIALPVDTVLNAVGMRSLSAEVEALRDCAPDFQIIGDCWKPRRVLNAMRMGYDVGMHI